MENTQPAAEVMETGGTGSVPEPEPEMKAITDTPDKGSFDTVIAGAGPAGITAGVYLGRKRINTIIISPDLGGQVLWTSDVENYPGYGVISGYELAENMKAQLMIQQVYLRMGDSIDSLDINKNGGGRVRTALGAEYTFKTLVIASGKRSRPLGVPGEEKFVGRGITYCATCDGPLYRGKPVAVIGGGNSALTSANELLDLGCRVHLVNIQPGFQADKILVERAKSREGITFYSDHRVGKILGDTRVTGITVIDNKTEESTDIEVNGVFVEIGLIPNSSFAEGVVGMNDKKEIKVNCKCETDVISVFAAGDVTNVPNKQIVIAAGEGAKSALSVSAYLLKGSPPDW